MKYLKSFEKLNDDYTQLFEDVKWVKEQFSDYKEAFDFFADIDKHIYDKDFITDSIGFGFCNDSKSYFQPMFKSV